ncbi:MAG: hypothetical protein RI897_3227 [Verrucomicrobiota bacterium]
MGVHGAVDIRVGVEAGAFVVDGAGGVALFHPGVGGFEVGAVAGFIAHGPDEDGGVVFIAFHEVGDAVEVGGFPFRLIGESFARVIADAVAFDIGFIDEVESVGVAEVVPFRVVGVVTGADCVDVVALHEEDVLEHGGTGDRVAGVGVHFVAVDAADNDGLAVEKELGVFDGDVAEADGGGDGFDGFALIGLEREDGGVEVGGFGGPGFGVGDGEVESGLGGGGGGGGDGVVRERCDLLVVLVEEIELS